MWLGSVCLRDTLRECGSCHELMCGWWHKLMCGSWYEFVCSAWHEPLTEEIRLERFRSRDLLESPIHLLRDGDSVYTTETLIEILGTPPWTRVWYVLGLPWKLVRYFGSRNDFKSDLLRLWCVSLLDMSVSLFSAWVCLSFRKTSCFLDDLIAQGQYVLCARDRVHIKYKRPEYIFNLQSTYLNGRELIQMIEYWFKRQSKSCFLNGFIAQGQYILCLRDRIHIEWLQSVGSIRL